MPSCPLDFIISRLYSLLTTHKSLLDYSPFFCTIFSLTSRLQLILSPHHQEEPTNNYNFPFDPVFLAVPSSSKMGSCWYFRNGIFTKHNTFLLLSLLLLSSNNMTCLAEGRRTTRKLLLQVSQREGVDPMMDVRVMIGSRPPTCIRRCKSCGHCEAVLVPVVPKNQNGAKPYLPTRLISRGDDGYDSSNYKPINWKCKCGDFIFNP